MREQGIDDKKIWRKIENICIKAIISVENTLTKAFEECVPHRSNCFELLGFDIMIDA